MAVEEDRKLFVGRLPLDIKEQEIHMIFSTYGKVTDVYVLQSSLVGKAASAFVTYEAVEAARAAIQVLDNVYKFRTDPLCEPIRVSIARPRQKGEGKGSDNVLALSNGSRGDFNSGNSFSQGGSQGFGSGCGSAGGCGSGGGYGCGAGAPSLGGCGSGGGGYGAWSCGAGARDYGSGIGCGGVMAYGGGGCGGGLSCCGGMGCAGGMGCGGGGGCGGGMGCSGGMSCGGGGCGGGTGGAGGGKGGPPGCKIYVSNLPGDITREALQLVFRTYGQCVDIHVMQGRAKSGQSAAFVSFSTPEQASSAIAAMQTGYEIRPGEGNILVKYADDGSRRAKPY